MSKPIPTGIFRPQRIVSALLAGFLASTSVSAQEAIDFETLATGTVVNTVFGNQGTGPIAVFGFNPKFLPFVPNAAVVFDSANPSPGDLDLGTPNADFGGPGIGSAGQAGMPFQNATPLGKTLILDAFLTDANGDGLVDQPNDSDSVGSFLAFDFSPVGTVTLSSVTVMDVEDKEAVPQIFAITKSGGVLGPLNLANVGDNGVANIDLFGIKNIIILIVVLNGSGAIDNVVFQVDDCDGDGIPDVSEPDCDGDGIPDDCEPDCDSDGIPDDCDGPDCNNNGRPDNCDIEDGTSQDVNNNGIPDECEPDCDNDGIPDDAEPDCDGDGIPDDCEPDCDSDGIPDDCDGPDCNNNGRPDNCDIEDGTSQDVNNNGIPDECEPDCDNDGIPDDAEPDCDGDGIPDDCEPDCDSDGIPDDCDGPDCNNNGRPDNCDIEDGTSQDVNNNGIPDECEPDCDNDGIPDDVEPDCDNDGTPDDCEPDCDNDGIPDDCDGPDCDNDGIPDECEPDCDADGIPDDCDTAEPQSFEIRWDFDDCKAFSDSEDFDEFTAKLSGACPNLLVDASNVFLIGENHSCTNDAITGEFGNAMCIDSAGGFVFDQGDDDTVLFSVLLTEQDGDVARLKDFCFYQQAPLVFIQSDSSGIVNTGTNDPPSLFGFRVLRDGQEILKLVDLDTTVSWSEVCFEFGNDPDFAVSNGSALFEFELLPYGVIDMGGSDDIWDLDEFKITVQCSDASGGTGDCDGDGIPDYCEEDCNNNGVPDDCDILDGNSTDNDGNGILDECEVQCLDAAVPDPDFSTSSGNHAFWFGDCLGKDWFPDPILEISFDSGNGTAHITGSIARASEPDEKFLVDLTLSGLIEPGDINYPPDGSPKLNQIKESALAENEGPIDPETWSYYTNLDGTLTGLCDFEGAVYSVEERGAAPQFGKGASAKNANPGIGTWFEIMLIHEPDHGSLPWDCDGDINVDLIDCPSLTSSSIAHWDFREQSGTTVHDQDGNLDLVFFENGEDISWVSDADGFGVRFDQDEDGEAKIATTSSSQTSALRQAIQASDELTIQVHYAQDLDSEQWSRLFAWSNDSSTDTTNFHLEAHPNDGDLLVETNMVTSSGVVQQLPGMPWGAGEVGVVTVTWDSATGKLRTYANGVEVAVTDYGGDCSDWVNRPLSLGNDGSEDRAFSGTLYDVRIWDQALSPVEVALEANALLD